MILKKTSLTIVLLLWFTQLFGQTNYLTQISYAKNEYEYQCRVISSRKVPFGSIWLPENKRLVVYIRNSVWSGDTNSIVPKEGPVKKMFIRQSEGDPGVVEFIVDFNVNRKYAIDYSGLDIVTYIEGDAPLNRRSFTGSMDQKNRIERNGALYASNKITMDYRGADLPNVLRLLAAQNNVNIVAGKDVSGNVTLSLRQVTLKEALDNILYAGGYDYVMNDDVILVKKNDTFFPALAQTKVYHLKYINADNLKKIILDMLPEKAKIQVLSPEFYNQFEAGSKNETKDQNALKKRSSTLIVTERPDVIAKIDEIVAQLDIPSPQIIIESKLLELAPLQRQTIGIDWDKTLTASLVSDDVLPSGDNIKYSAMNDGLQRHSSWKLGHLTASQFSVVLDFLQEATETKLISNPRVIATDNVTSRISVGTTFPVPQINRGMAGQGDIVTFNYKDVDIELNVTPHVVNTNEIIMYVNPIIEEITGEVVVDINRAPITSKRSVNTVVTVKDGETIVIGGMIKEDRKKTVSKVFLLGEIPLIGNLFRHTSYEKKQKDLVIFITPHILR